MIRIAKQALFAGLLAVASLGGQASQPGIGEWATVEAHDNGVPVYAFGYTYVYGVSPDFRPGSVLQEGNKAPARKIQPKRSWEIQSNLFGSTPAREPRTAPYDDQPLLGIHLIDGDVRSCWASRGQNRPDFEDAWIRIDLPLETMIRSVVLTGHPEGLGKADAARNVYLAGQAFPRKLEIRTSRDAWHWTTVFKTDHYTPQNIAGRNEIAFTPLEAKQIWIVGSDLPLAHYFGHSFSIAEAEVLDSTGKNVALVSRGAGVQVSSTHTGFGMDRFTQDMLWPTQYDLGFKWSRVGYDMSLFQWAYVEREKGKYYVDPRAEATLTEAVKNGVRMILCLDKGNWLYAPGSVVKDRTRDLMETYSNNPGTTSGWQKMLLDNPAELEGYLNYIRFVVRHFKDRVQYYEVYNEWNPYTYAEAKQYARLLKAAIPVIRKEYPQAKILPASPGWLQSFPDRSEHEFSFFQALGDEGLLSQVDVLAFHPFYDPPHSDAHLATFPSDFQRFKKMAEGYGFKGNEYIASEWDYFTAYPQSDLPGYADREQHSEMQKAIYASRLSTMFANLGIVNLWNETFQTMMTVRGLSLFRNSFSNEVICPTQPEVVYYMFRTMATALENTKGAAVPVTFTERRLEPIPVNSPARRVEYYGFQRDNGEKLIAFWLPGYVDENGKTFADFTADLGVKGVKGAGATIIDVLNGTETPLNVDAGPDGVMIKGLHVQSWPLIVKLR